MQLQEVTLEHDALHEQLARCQTKCLGLKQDVATHQQTLQEALTRAIEVEKERLNFVEDIEHYHKMLIDMKK
jgi:predicted  nucleic acid-binding Zn-ribbon protein